MLPWNLERETGIEPATNSLEGCDSTTELLPPNQRSCRVERRDTRPLAHLPAPNLELMTGIEPVTSPLPRECSTD